MPLENHLLVETQHIEDIEFFSCSPDSAFIPSAESLFQREWSDIILEPEQLAKSELPPILVAVKGREVVGALAYTWFEQPQTSNKVVWINALYVDAAYRQRGIAQQLIRLSEKALSSLAQSQLYAYTNVPQLYRSVGWRKVEEAECEAGHAVMMQLLDSAD